MGLVLPHQLPWPFLYPHLNMSLMGGRLETDMKKNGLCTWIDYVLHGRSKRDLIWKDMGPGNRK